MELLGVGAGSPSSGRGSRLRGADRGVGGRGGGADGEDGHIFVSSAGYHTISCAGEELSTVLGWLRAELAGERVLREGRFIALRGGGERESCVAIEAPGSNGTAEDIPLMRVPIHTGL